MILSSMHVPIITEKVYNGFAQHNVGKININRLSSVIINGLQFLFLFHLLATNKTCYLLP